MLEKPIRTTAFLAAFLLASVLPVSAQRSGQPHRFNPNSLDEALVSLVDPGDGRVWSAWAYRSGAEYDIAISFRDGSGFWSEPLFLGRDDRRDQIQPTLTLDPAGNLYLAYVERTSGAIMLAALPHGADAWLPAVAATSAGERGFLPALAVVADRLVLAFRSSGRTVVIRDFPLLQETRVERTIQDGPDPFGATGGGATGGYTPGGGSRGGSNGGATGSSSERSSDPMGFWPTRAE